MSAKKIRPSSEDMFHIQYPAQRDFFSWTELGCLARALGFPTDLIRHNVTEEIETEEGGIYVQQLYKMIELKLLNQTLHRSFNMHTADWNLCVIRKALRLLNLSALSFEELHNIRVAYDTYEAGDMKGLILDQRTLLRTLKMCHRIISPKKLMHRVKHMRSQLEEANRIQLYEFMDLILWCDYMEKYQHSHQVGYADGKDKDLYKLVDFESLLSHQDQRCFRALDKRYLAEEWDFGREHLGSKHMFKGEVVYTDQRIKQTRTQKKNYRGLKKAVGQSQRRVYRAHAGSIRHRPISAPDLSMYSSPRGTSRARTTSAAAMYHSVQRRLYSASSRPASRVDLSDRPAIPEYVRAHTPSVVTRTDLDDVKVKMEKLHFDITTLETRCQVKKEEEMKFYIPEYSPSSSQNNSDGAEKEEKRTAEHWTPDIIDNLAYPHYHLPPHHAHTCDARFRGWRPSDHSGRHRILTVPTFDNSPHGQLLAKQRSAMLAPVANMHKDYVIRYTSRKEATEQQKTKRPCTAPMASPRSKPVKRIGCRSAGNNMRRSDPEGHDTSHDRHGGKNQSEDENGDGGLSVAKSFPDPTGKYSQAQAKTSASSKNELVAEDSGQQDFSAAVVSSLGASTRISGSADPSLKTEGVKSERNEETSAPQESSMAVSSSIRHSGSKTVDVGLIGTITLLESIQEQETEDRLSETLSSRSTRSPSPDQQAIGLSSAGQMRHHEIRNQPNTPLPPGWSRHPQSSSGKERSDVNTLHGSLAAEAQKASTTMSKPDQEIKNSASLGSNNKISRPGQAEHIPKQRFPLSWAVTGQQDYSSNLVSKVRVDLPPRTEQSPTKSRISSATSSIMSDATDYREVPTPITSVTVTVKNKNQNVTTSTRINNDVEDQRDVVEGHVPSPMGFKQSSPCVTSTPRRKRTSPTTNLPRNQMAGYINPNFPKGKQITYVGNPSLSRTSPAGYNINPNPASTPTNNPASAGKERSKSAASLPESEPNADLHLSWIQDQILAMNSACEQKQEETVKDKDLDEKKTDGDIPPEEELQYHGEKKKAIHFSPDIPDPREIAYQQRLERRKASEALLKLHSYDLNAETQRRFTFNASTTRRLLHRVQDAISPELKTRLKTGNMGLKVI